MKGVIWVRISSIDQSAGYSPDAQLRALREAAARKSIEVAKEFNVSESAKTSEARKQFRELIQYLFPRSAREGGSVCPGIFQDLKRD